MAEDNYAVIRTGGKQYRVRAGETFRVDRLDTEVGSDVTFDEVLMTGGAQVVVGDPLVKNAKVTARVVAQDRAKKIVVFKMKRRKGYRRRQGHRQPFTELQVTNIKAS